MSIQRGSQRRRPAGPFEEHYNAPVLRVAGVPARQNLRGRLSATHVREQDGQVELLETDEEIDRHTAAAPPDGAAGLSFARDPFAVTQATAALILWLGGILYDKLG